MILNTDYVDYMLNFCFLSAFLFTNDASPDPCESSCVARICPDELFLSATRLCAGWLHVQWTEYICLHVGRGRVSYQSTDV